MVYHDGDYVIKHALVYTNGEPLPDAIIMVEQGFITYVGKHDEDIGTHTKLTCFDAKGSLVGPGLVDMHLHGGGGFDSTQGNIQENLEGLALFLAGKGITSFN